MNQDEYKHYNSMDAQPILWDVLNHFFESHKHRFKYDTAYQDFRRNVSKNKYITSRRLFDVMAGTSLVADKQVQYNKSNNGLVYYISKSTINAIDRDKRLKRRTSGHNTTVATIQLHTPATTKQSVAPIATHNHYEELESDGDDSTILDLIVPETMEPHTNKGIMDDEEECDNHQVSTETQAIPDSVLKGSYTFEQEARAGLQQFHEVDNERTNLQDSIKIYIDNMMTSALNDMELKNKQHIHHIHADAESTAMSIKAIEQDCKSRSEKLSNTIQQASAQINVMEADIQGYRKKATELFSQAKDTLTDITGSASTYMEGKFDKMDERINNTNARINNVVDKHQASGIGNIDTIKQLTIDLKKIHNQHKRRLEKLHRAKDDILDDLEEKATKLFQEMKHSAKSFLTKEIRSRTRISRRKLFSSSSDSSASENDGKTKHHSHFKKDVDTTEKHGIFDTDECDKIKEEPVTPHRYRTSDISKLNPDYIRKNVKVKCTQDSQIFEFYTKLRIAVQKGGIYLIPLEDVKKEDSLADLTISRNLEHINDQSNALYTVLSNEDVIPQEYTMAQNCILSCSTTMDGLRALKKILTQVHPTLTQKKPPEKAPVYSDFDDLHLYEQGLRHHYKLHYLYCGFSYSEIEKSKQFLRGMDTNIHDDAVRRITSIIDTVETQKLLMSDDHKIDNLASTINNMTNEHSSIAQINVMRWGNNHHNKNGSRNRRSFNGHNGPRYQQHSANPNTRRDNKRPSTNPRFTNIQCHACKTFGHRVHDCRILPKVLAILQFAEKEKVTCDKILQKYTSFNSVSNKTAMVHALRDIGAWDGDDTDIDNMLQDDAIINSTFINMDDDWTASNQE